MQVREINDTRVTTLNRHLSGSPLSQNIICITLIMSESRETLLEIKLSGAQTHHEPFSLHSCRVGFYLLFCSHMFHHNSFHVTFV